MTGMPVIEFRNAMLTYTEFIWRRRRGVPLPAFRRTVVFKDFTWAVKGGTAVLLKGPNGSGKSTLLRAAAGLLQPIAGEVWRCGQPATSPSDGSDGKTEFVSDKTSAFYRLLTVEQNLKIWGLLNGMPRNLVKKRMQYIVQSFELNDILNIRLASLSSGQLQRFAVAIKMLTLPQLLLLDEPWRSIDMATQSRLMDAVYRYIRSQGARVLIMAAHMCDHLESYFDEVIDLDELSRETPTIVPIRMPSGSSPPAVVSLDVGSSRPATRKAGAFHGTDGAERANEMADFYGSR